MMKTFYFTSVFGNSVKEEVLNPEGILVPQSQMRMTLTPKQIVDLMEQLAIALPNVLYRDKD